MLSGSSQNNSGVLEVRNSRTAVTLSQDMTDLFLDLGEEQEVRLMLEET